MIKLPYETEIPGKKSHLFPEDHPWYCPKDDLLYIPLALRRRDWTRKQKKEFKRRNDDALYKLTENMRKKREATAARRTSIKKEHQAKTERKAKRTRTKLIERPRIERTKLIERE